MVRVELEDVSLHVCVALRPDIATVVVSSCKTCDHSISQAFNGAAARGEAHLARIPDPFEAPRAKTIGSTTNIAIGEAHLALFVMWCPGGARSMFRTVSQIRAVKWSNHVKLALPRCGSAGSGRDEPAPPRFLLSRE